MPERKVWFITRPERDPKFHVDALEALEKATNGFTMKWSRNRIAHKKYEEVLGMEGLKRDNISADGSGGRTWAAMLRTFGYVYIKEDGTLNLTKVGKALLSGHKVRDNISKQILTLQIPNSYFLESGFRPKYEPDFQIRPARFLIRLVNQSVLNFYLTKEEITFFALSAKKDNELIDVTERILHFRSSSDQEKDEIKKNIASISDHRERSDKVARDFTAAHGDVAHTFMMLCDYTGLCDYIRGDALRVPSERQQNTTNKLQEIENRYPFNKRYLLSLQRFSENAGLDIDSYKASGFDEITQATNRSKSDRKVQKLLASFPSIQTLTKDELTKILEQEFSTNEASKYASSLKTHEFTSLNDTFMDAYLNETDNLIFEDKTAEIFKAIGFEVELRPRPSQSEIRTQIEILLHIDENTVCILDAKNYKKNFALSAHLASHMGSEYIPNYHGYKGKAVAYFGYITASEWSGERNLAKITQKAEAVNPQFKALGAMFSGKALLGFLDYCLDNNIPLSLRREMFLALFKNKGYSNVSEMI